VQRYASALYDLALVVCLSQVSGLRIRLKVQKP